jgi:hypothetical protein
MFILASIVVEMLDFQIGTRLTFELLFLNKMVDLSEVVVRHRKLGLFGIFFANYEINICFVLVY